MDYAHGESTFYEPSWGKFGETFSLLLLYSFEFAIFFLA